MNMNVSSKSAVAAAGILVGASMYAFALRRSQRKSQSSIHSRTVSDLVRPNIASLEPYRCARYASSPSFSFSALF